MQDIDFDELDRAVSSLTSATPDMGNKTAAPADESVSVNVSPKSTEPALTSAIPPIASQTSVIPPIGSATQTAQAPSTIVQNRPNLGRSMDFIRPSQPAQVMQRQNPANSVVPITTQPAQNVSETVKAVPNSGPIGGVVMDQTNDISEPPESPFISDAKVEKRPLGAFSEGKVPENEPAEANSPTYAAAVALENSAVEGKDENPSISVDTPLPAELQNNLLEIESSDATQTNVVIPQQTEVETQKSEDNHADMPIAELIENSKKPETAETAVESSGTAVTTSTPSPVNSIPQQYPASADTSPRNTGPIFDTSVYHNSANIKPIKKSNAWIWVLITVLILIGATIGVGIYLFVK